MPHRVRNIVVAVTSWHLICLVMLYVYTHGIAQNIVALYTAAFGDIQSNYGIYYRIAILHGYAAITAPASLASLFLFDRLSHRSAGRNRVVCAVCVWQLVVVAVLLGSYEMQFAWWLHQLGWAVFGVPENLYSFRNLALHRIVAWFICTTPVACAALWLYSKNVVEAQDISADRIDATKRIDQMPPAGSTLP